MARRIASVANNKIIESLILSQKDLHSWGTANRLFFDPSKKGIHALSAEEPYGKEFKILGLGFGTGITMKSTVDELVIEARWKIVVIYKTHL